MAHRAAPTTSPSRFSPLLIQCLRQSHSHALVSQLICMTHSMHIFLVKALSSHRPPSTRCCNPTSVQAFPPMHSSKTYAKPLTPQITTQCSSTYTGVHSRATSGTLCLTSTERFVRGSNQMAAYLKPTTLTKRSRRVVPCPPYHTTFSRMTSCADTTLLVAQTWSSFSSVPKRMPMTSCVLQTRKPASNYSSMSAMRTVTSSCGR